MRRHAAATLACATLLLLTGQLGAQRPAAATKLYACRLLNLAEDVLCGSYTVPENRGRDNGRSIALNIVVLPATTDTVLPDAITFLAGGGVVPATRYAPFLARSMAAVRRQRDILLVDQRGTWNSGALACEGMGGPAEDGGALARCRAALAQRTDLTAYTTTAAMADLDAVRAWLGYEQLDLYGSSYGTKAAQVYMRQYPNRVRAAVLRGVVPLALPMQLDLAASAQASLERVFDLCAQDVACQRAYPQVRSEFDALLARLAAQPAAVTVESADGAAQSITLNDRMVRNVVQSALALPAAAADLPALIHSAFTGDYQPLARAALPPPAGGPAGPPLGVFYSILCSEELPKVADAAVDRATAGSFFGAAPVRSQLRACTDWPRAQLPVEFWQPVASVAPILLLSGDLDPITPPRYADSVAVHMPNARHVILPNRSHGDTDPCIGRLVEAFLLAGTAAGLDTACVSEHHPLRFVR